MKKFFKRFLSLALILASVLSISVTAMAAYSTMYVNCPEGETVRLRDTASTSGKVLVNIPYGTAVQAEKYNNTWHKVKYGNYNGYMMSNFLSSSPVNFSTMYVTCTPGETVRFRDSASTNGIVLANIPNGTAVQAARYNETWHMVKYNNKTGYMMSEFLTTSGGGGSTEGWMTRYGTGNLSTSGGNSTSAQIRNLQSDLQYLGYSLGNGGVDGYYGDDTKNAVKQFQSEHNLLVDGVAGPNTKSLLFDLSIGNH